MTSLDFKKVVDAQLDYCGALLGVKSEEYADDQDRLQHFKKAGTLMNCDPKTALFGMLLKHLISLADMCTSGKTYTEERWNEKITDSINYLLLLRGLIEEETDGQDRR